MSDFFRVNFFVKPILEIAIDFLKKIKIAISFSGSGIKFFPHQIDLNLSIVILANIQRDCIRDHHISGPKLF